MTNDITRIHPSELREGLEGPSAFRLVDVRNPDEYEALHVRGAENVPLMQLLDQSSEWPRGERIHLICQQGPRSQNAAQQLRVAGFEDVAVIDGGTFGCARQGVPVVRGPRKLGVQQQMQLIVGTMIIVGAVGSFGATWLIAVALFGGVGLLFAGITGFCPLASALSRAPWNRPKPANREADRKTAACSHAAGQCSCG